MRTKKPKVLKKLEGGQGFFDRMDLTEGSRNRANAARNTGIQKAGKNFGANIGKAEVAEVIRDNTGVRSLKGTGLGTKTVSGEAHTGVTNLTPAATPTPAPTTSVPAPTPVYTKNTPPTALTPLVSRPAISPLIQLGNRTALETMRKDYTAPVDPYQKLDPNRLTMNYADGKESITDGKFNIGAVRGPGTGKSDSVGPARLPESGERAMLSRGETVVPADVTQKINKVLLGDPNGLEKVSLANHTNPVDVKSTQKRIADVGGQAAIAPFKLGDSNMAASPLRPKMPAGYRDGKKAKCMEAGGVAMTDEEIRKLPAVERNKAVAARDTAAAAKKKEADTKAADDWKAAHPDAVDVSIAAEKANAAIAAPAVAPATDTTAAVAQPAVEDTKYLPEQIKDTATLLKERNLALEEGNYADGKPSKLRGMGKTGTKKPMERAAGGRQEKPVSHKAKMFAKSQPGLHAYADGTYDRIRKEQKAKLAGNSLSAEQKAYAARMQPSTVPQPAPVVEAPAARAPITRVAAANPMSAEAAAFQASQAAQPAWGQPLPTTPKTSGFSRLAGKVGQFRAMGAVVNGAVKGANLLKTSAPALALAALNNTTSNVFDTPTEDYRKRFGMETNDPSLPGDVGVRLLGAASDIVPSAADFVMQGDNVRDFLGYRDMPDKRARQQEAIREVNGLSSTQPQAQPGVPAGYETSTVDGILRGKGSNSFVGVGDPNDTTMDDNLHREVMLRKNRDAVAAQDLANVTQRFNTYDAPEKQAQATNAAQQALATQAMYGGLADDGMALDGGGVAGDGTGRRGKMPNYLDVQKFNAEQENNLAKFNNEQSARMAELLKGDPDAENLLQTYATLGASELGAAKGMTPEQQLPLLRVLGRLKKNVVFAKGAPTDFSNDMLYNILMASQRNPEDNLTGLGEQYMEQNVPFLTAAKSFIPGTRVNTPILDKDNRIAATLTGQPSADDMATLTRFARRPTQ